MRKNIVLVVTGIVFVCFFAIGLIFQNGVIVKFSIPIVGLVVLSLFYEIKKMKYNFIFYVIFAILSFSLVYQCIINALNTR